MILIFIIVLVRIQSSCTDKPGCFATKLMDWDRPQQGVYTISISQDNLQTFSIKGYGDFNNDLTTDFIALSQDGNIQIFIWNDIDKIFKMKTNIQINDCQPKTLYLYDVNSDGKLDFTIWGQNDEKNCLIPFINNSTDEIINFIRVTGIKMIFNLTKDPIILRHSYKWGQIYAGFLLYSGQKRIILRYNQFIKQYQTIQWNKMFTSTQSFQGVEFADRHWNSFIDLTGDCLTDLVIINERGELQFWIGTQSGFTLSNDQVRMQLNLTEITTISFSDLDYDGAVDLIIGYKQYINVYKNSKSVTSVNQFCCTGCRSFNFNSQPLQFFFESGLNLVQQNLHFGDLDIDGYPDLLLILQKYDKSNQLIILKNNAGQNFYEYTEYTKPINEVLKYSKVQSASFMDILENGIVDIIVILKDSSPSVRTFYNNYKNQNNFYLKGSGLIGSNSDSGSMINGVSFYWISSLSEGNRVACLSQIIQTGYTALQMPYVVNGLGRINDYVSSFTIGNGLKSKQWSPIIPNSQLAVFTTPGDTLGWKIKVFFTRLKALLFVASIMGILLIIVGIILCFKKTWIRKKDNVIGLIN